MENVFLQILNMSVSASWLMLAVIGIRFLMQKVNAPKNFRYILWALVAIRLICPFTIESAMSLLPRQEVLPEEFQISKENKVDSLVEVKEEEEIIHEHIYGIDNIVLKPDNSDEIGDTPSGEFLPDPESVTGNSDVVTSKPQNQNTDETSNYIDVEENFDITINWKILFSWIWTVGVFGLFLYSIICYINLYKKVQASICIEDNVWICDDISGPFLLGVFNPRIYMPSDIREEQIPYIIAHEKEHVRYMDYLWKPFGFVVLALHWFNPLVWIAYMLMCKDIEYACDERVIRNMDNEQKKMYSESLLCCSSPRHYISACPVAFGETSIKERIKNVVDYKKPAVWIVGIGIIACVIIAVCFMTNPPSEAEKPSNPNGSNGVDENVIQGGVPDGDVNDDTIYLPYVENKVLYETTADLSHDGIEDLVQTVLIYHPSEGTGDNINHRDNSVVVKVFLGLEEGGYEMEVANMTNAISMSTSPLSRDTYVLTEKDGRDYLVHTNRDHSTSGTLICSYEVMYIENGAFTMFEKSSTTLIYDYETDKWTPAHGEGLLVDFEEGYASWFRDGIVLITFEAMNSGFYSEEGNLILAGEYFDSIWPVDDSLLDGAYTGGTQIVLDWYANYKTHNADSLSYLIKLVGFDELYATYDGEDVCHIFVDDDNGVMTRGDVIYYRTQETDTQKVLKEMVSIMVEALMEPSEYRGYTITDYRIDDMEIIPGDENIWFIRYIQGAYKYDGVDMMTFEEQAEWTGIDEDGLIPFFGQGSDGQFYYILVKNGDVYRLERGGLFESRYNYIFENYVETSVQMDYVGPLKDGDPYSYCIGGTWDGFLRDVEGTDDSDIEWFETQIASDFSEWFDDYNGQSLQRIEGCGEDCQGSCSVANSCDTIYYKAVYTDSFQDIVHNLIEAIILPRMEDSENRTFTITDYELMEQGLMQVSDHMWILYFIDGYYAFEGIDTYSMEESYPKKDDLVSFQSRLGDADGFYIIIEENGVYRMQRYPLMVLQSM